MPSTTPNLALRYPLSTEAPDAPGAIANLAADVDAHLGSSWTTYSPGFQNINLNFATKQWRYRQDRVLVRLDGTVTGTGSGTFLVATPTATGGSLVNGTAILRRASTQYRLVPQLYSNGLVQFFTGNPESPVTGTSPAAWANGDVFSALFEYDPS